MRAIRWSIVDHCCQHCLGRIMKGEEVYRCADCGSEATRCSAICACGITIAGLQEKRQVPRAKGRAGRKKVVEVTKPKWAGFRCGRNPLRTVQCPREIIVILDGTLGELEREIAAALGGDVPP